MAALGWKTPNGYKFKCGGSLISEKFILTVSHCVTDKTNGEHPSIVRIGDYDLALSDDGAHPIDFTHEKYNLKTNRTSSR